MNTPATCLKRHLIPVLVLSALLLSGGTGQAADTLPASGVLGRSATLNGSALPGGLPTAAWFEWGTTTNYGSVTPQADLGSGTSPAAFSLSISNLAPVTTYHFRTVATNSAGTSLGTNQTFTTAAGFARVPVADLPGVDTSAVSWVDFDNDGRMDFLVTGTTNGLGSGTLSRLWRNTGNGFTNVPVPGLPDVDYAAVGWADYDRDGWMDLLITGTTNGIASGLVAQLWRNTGAGFSNVTATAAPGLPPVNQGAVAWGDFNNDGRPDLFISGISAAGKTAQIWLNAGSAFTNATAAMAPGLGAAALGAVAPADFDNDGRLDFLFTGELTNGAITAQLWRNTGSGFVEVTDALAPGLPGTVFGDVAWMDFNRDGRLDFLLTGETAGSDRVTQLWANTGSGFTNVPLPELPGVRYSAISWGDYDNDGRPDFLLSGNPPGDLMTELWRNTGTGFTSADAGLDAAFSFTTKSSAAADYDNDGRLDLLVTGYLPLTDSQSAQLWHSEGYPANTPPPAPANLTASVTNNLAWLSWTPPVDAASGTNLSFNLRVGTTPGAADVVSPEANVADGFRRLPALGNAQFRTFARLNLPAGTYYWSVQAVDAGFAGGPFATEGTFTIGPETVPVLSIASSGTDVIVSWAPASPGWILQTTGSLAPSHWTNAPSGSLNPVTLPASDPSRFFRLFRP